APPRITLPEPDNTGGQCAPFDARLFHRCRTLHRIRQNAGGEPYDPSVSASVAIALTSQYSLSLSTIPGVSGIIVRA
ncbi:hypothetical protein, partial [Nocardia carnea]|uniref:hypothetical protein n=1 Tax=Nocardia carnea TaxID=37328 RepID=UPI001C3F1B14